MWEVGQGKVCRVDGIHVEVNQHYINPLFELGYGTACHLVGLSIEAGDRKE
jgi:hypothetical protein